MRNESLLAPVGGHGGEAPSRSFRRRSCRLLASQKEAKEVAELTKRRGSETLAALRSEMDEFRKYMQETKEREAPSRILRHFGLPNAM